MNGIKRTFILSHDTARDNAIQAVKDAPEGHCVVIKPANRSLEQNALMWPLLQELSENVDWHGNKLSDEEWKDVLSASLKQQKVVPGIDGGFVVLGQRTSQMTKKDFSELLELIYAFGAQQGIDWKVAA